MKKRIIGLVISFSFAVLLSGCSGQDSKAGAVHTEKAGIAEDEADTFTVGFDQDFPPMGFVGDDGAYTGFDLELAKEVADRLQKKFVPQPIAWDSKDMELEAGNIDCIWNGFTMTGRENGYTWSKPYMENTQVFVVDGNSGIQSVADLKGKVIEVQADSSAEAALKEKPELTKIFGTYQTTPDYNTAFMDLDMGAVDAIAMDVIVAAYQIEQRASDFVILKEPISSEEYAVGFKTGNIKLRDQVQAQLDAMAKDGTMKRISEKWFGRDVTIMGQ